MDAFNIILPLWIEFIVYLLAGVGLTLFGLRMTSLAVQRIFWSTLRASMKLVGKSYILTLLAGTLIAFFVQSGMVTSLMAVGFSASGQLSLMQFIGVVMGAPLGGVPLAMAFLFSSPWLVLVLLAVGTASFFFVRWGHLREVGQVILGLALSFSGFLVLEHGWGLAPILSDMIWLAWLVLALLAGYFVHSVLLVLVVVMAAVSGGGMSPTWGVYMVIATNLVMVLPRILPNRTNSHISKAASGFQLAVYGVVSVLVLVFMNQLIYSSQILLHFQPWAPSDRVIKTFIVPYGHLVFQVGAILCSLLLVWPYERLIKSRHREGQGVKEPQRLQLIEQSVDVAPVLAIEQATGEVTKLAAMVETVLQLTLNFLRGEQIEEAKDKVIKYESITDNIHDELNNFMARLIEAPLSAEQSRAVLSLQRVAKELEGAADKCCFVVHKYSALRRQDEKLAVELGGELSRYAEQVLVEYELVFTFLMNETNGVKSIEREHLKMFNDDSFTRKVANEDHFANYDRKKLTAHFESALFDIHMSLNRIRLHSQNIYQAVDHWKSNESV